MHRVIPPGATKALGLGHYIAMEHVKVDVNRLVEQETVIYFEAFDDAYMTARADVGIRKAVPGKSKKRVITMTEEVLDLANSCIAQLGLLQEEYVELHQQQSAEEDPAYKGAWGKMHVMSALLQQLRSEVDEELEEKRKTGKPITVYDKRNAWNKRANQDWRDALRVNAKLDKATQEKLAESTKRNHAAAAMIQNIWKSRQQRKKATQQKNMQQTKTLQRQVLEDMASNADTVLREQTMLKHRERNIMRKKENISFKTFRTVDTEYEKTGTLRRVDVIDGHSDEGDVLELNPLKEDLDEESSDSDEEDERPEPRKFKLLQKKNADLKPKRGGLTAGRLAALAAPKQVTDRPRDVGSGTVWRGGGAFQKKPTASVPRQHFKRNESYLQRGMLQKKSIVQNSGSLFHQDPPATSGNQGKVSVVSIGSNDHGNSPWQVVRTTVIATTRLGRLKQAAMRPKSWRSWKTIPATKSMKMRVHKLQQQFDRFSDKVDDWVKGNRHILDLIVHDDQHPSGKSDDETVSDSQAQKELVGHQILVMSSMWAVMKQNLMQMQEKVLGFTPGRPVQESDSFSREEMKDGTATVMKMWRDLSESTSPFSVALGNHDPEELIARMMKRAKEDDRRTKSKQQAKQGQSFRKRLGALSLDGAGSGFKQMGYEEQQQQQQQKLERQRQLEEERQRMQAQQVVIRGGLSDAPLVGTSMLQPVGSGSSRDAAESEQNNRDSAEMPQEPASSSLPSESLPDTMDIRPEDVPPESGGSPAPDSALGRDAGYSAGAPRSDAAVEIAPPSYGLGVVPLGSGSSNPTSSNAAGLIPNRSGGPSSDARGTSGMLNQGNGGDGPRGEKPGSILPEPSREPNSQHEPQPGGMPLSGATSEDLAIVGAGTRPLGLKRQGSSGALPRISEDALDFVPDSAAPTAEQLLALQGNIGHARGHQTAFPPSSGLPPRPTGKGPGPAGPNLGPRHARVGAKLNPVSAIGSQSAVPNKDGLSPGAQREPAEAVVPARRHPHQRPNSRGPGGEGFGFSGEDSRRLASRNTRVKNLVHEVDQLFQGSPLPAAGRKALVPPATAPKAEHEPTEPLFLKRPDTVGVLQPAGQLKAHARPGFHSTGTRLPFEYRNNSTAQHMRQSLPDIRSGAVHSTQRSRTAGLRSVPLTVSMDLTTDNARPATMPNYLGPLKGISPKDVKQRLATPAWQLDKSQGGLQPTPPPKTRPQQ